MPKFVTLQIDVGDVSGLGSKAVTVVTVVLPDPKALTESPVVCFAFPGGGYGRRYFTLDLLEGSEGGQAGWHAERGWIFVACDSLGTGEATIPDPTGRPTLTLEGIARANRQTVEIVTARLREGTVDEAFPPIPRFTTVGLGQSMGGAFTVTLAAQHSVFDAVAVLGFSAIHTQIPPRPGSPAIVYPWVLRGSDSVDPIVVNQSQLDAANQERHGDVSPSGEAPIEHPLAWAFHYDDVPSEVVAADLAGYAEGPLMPWRSATLPACAVLLSAPGVIATEAVALSVPILIAVGERDVVPDPRLEAKAYVSSPDITVFVCPRMAHMHNFAGTREALWRRLHAWATAVPARTL